MRDESTEFLCVSRHFRYSFGGSPADRLWRPDAGFPGLQRTNRANLLMRHVFAAARRSSPSTPVSAWATPGCSTRSRGPSRSCAWSTGVGASSALTWMTRSCASSRPRRLHSNCGCSGRSSVGGGCYTRVPVSAFPSPTCRSGEIGRRAGLKIPWGSPPVWVRFPPPAPAFAHLPACHSPQVSFAWAGQLGRHPPLAREGCPVSATRRQAEEIPPFGPRTSPPRTSLHPRRGAPSLGGGSMSQH
jgi:hypothetical protein